MEIAPFGLSNGELKLIKSPDTLPASIIPSVGGASPGDLLFSFQDSPSGYLEANGQAVSQATYANLFGVIGLVPDEVALGDDWEVQTVPASSLPIYSFASGNGFLLTTYDNDIWKSTDGGSSWYSVASGVGSRLAFANGVFVCVNTSGTIKTSPDGVTWTNRTVPYGAILFSLHRGNGLFVVGGYSSSTFTTIIWTSPDGVTWTNRTPPATVSKILYAGFYANGLHMIIGGEICWTSPDGVTWSVKSYPSSGANYGLAYSNGRWVTLSTPTNSTPYYSDNNGTSWTAGTSPESRLMRSVAFANGLFVAGGNSGKVWTSPDGVTWSIESTPNSYQINTVNFYPNIGFLIGGNSGQIWINPNVYDYDEETDFRLPDVTPPTSTQSLKSFIKT